MTRTCDGCDLCCVAPRIDEPELKKETDTPCASLCGKRCGIYADRPTVCREFLCQWRVDHNVPKWLQPSKINAYLNGSATMPGICEVRCDHRKPLNKKLMRWLVETLSKNVSVQVFHAGVMYWITNGIVKSYTREQFLASQLRGDTVTIKLAPTMTAEQTQQVIRARGIK